MSVKIVDAWSFGGVNAQANPLAFPADKSLRSLNWVRTDGSWLRLRHGFTRPTMSGYASGDVHSAFQFVRDNGSKFILFSQGVNLKQMALSSGAVTSVYTFTSSVTWDAFQANNFLYIGNGVDPVVFSDSATVRVAGIRAPTSGETTTITVTENTGTTGTWNTTALSGYQLYLCYYNPGTGHVGNRTPVGSRLPITGTQSSIVVSNLPDLSGVNAEWVKLLGRTHDGGEVPYALIDGSGSWITVGNTLTTYTFTSVAVHNDSELPYRNTVPPLMAKMCYAGSRVYGINATNPRRINYSESAEDTIQGGGFMGRPEQAWPGNNAVNFPNGEIALGIHDYANNVFVHSRTHLSILTEYGGYNIEGRASPAWMGSWAGGIAGQRAFIKTKYGPFWVSPEKQLMTVTEAGPVAVSSEYEAEILGQIGNAYLSSVELSYLVDATKGIDRIYIRALNSSGSPIFAVHDFRHKNEGFNFTYTGLTPTTFVRSPEGLVSMRDTNDAWRLWAGAGDGRFYQLEDGDSDNGATYTADYITLLNFGWNQPLLAGVEWQGDSRAKVLAAPVINLTVAQLDARQFPAVELVDAETLRYRVSVEEGAQYMVLRMKLTSEATKGTLTDTSPKHIPVKGYGNIFVVRPEFGLSREVGGARP